MENIFKHLALSILHAAYYLCIIVTVVLPTFFADKMTETPRNYIGSITTLPWYKRRSLTKTGKLFVCALALSYALGSIRTYIDEEETKETHRNEIKLIDSLAEMRLVYRDSLSKIENEKLELERKQQVGNVQRSVDSTNYKLSQKSFQFDSLSFSLKKAQSEKNAMDKMFNRPILKEGANPDDSITPHLVRRKPGYLYNMFYGNFGKGEANDIRTTSMIVRYVNNKYTHYLGGGGRYDNKNSPLPSEHGSYYGVFMTDTDHESFICVELKYKNALGEEQIPSRLI